MRAEFTIVYHINVLREVRLVANTLEDAMTSARYLSANSDIRFSSLYLVTRANEPTQPEHTFLCQFEHGRVQRLQPLAEQLLERAQSTQAKRTYPGKTPPGAWAAQRNAGT